IIDLACYKSLSSRTYIDRRRTWDDAGTWPVDRMYSPCCACVGMSGEPDPKRKTYRWPKEARDLVREYTSGLEQANSESPRLATVRDLVTRLSALTGFPREACLRFARQLGATGKQSYRGWTRREQQRLLDLVSLYPPAEIAKIMGRTVGSIRGMLSRLHVSAQSGRDWFT